MTRPRHQVVRVERPDARTDEFNASPDQLEGDGDSPLTHEIPEFDDEAR